MHRIARTVAASSLLSSYNTQYRRQSGLNHNYLNRGPVFDGKGLEDGIGIAAGQQDSLDLEQFVGYSDSYLAPTASYLSRQERNNEPVKLDLLGMVLQICYDIYGNAADILQKLSADPLQVDFHSLLAKAVQHREEFGRKIDEMYPSAHPSNKTIIDAYAVRRYYFLMDWEKAVSAKRKEIIEKLSPEYIAESIRGKNLAEEYSRSLQQLGAFISSTKALSADIDESRLQPAEVEVLRKNATHYRKLRNYGRVMHDGDVNAR